MEAGVSQCAIRVISAPNSQKAKRGGSTKEIAAASEDAHLKELKYSLRMNDNARRNKIQ